MRIAECGNLRTEYSVLKTENYRAKMNSTRAQKFHGLCRFTACGIGIVILCSSFARPAIADEALLRGKFVEGQQLRLQLTQSLASETTVSDRKSTRLNSSHG